MDPIEMREEALEAIAQAMVSTEASYAALLLAKAQALATLALSLAASDHCCRCCPTT